MLLNKTAFSGEDFIHGVKIMFTTSGSFQALIRAHEYSDDKVYFTAYVAVPDSNKFFELNYEKINEELSIYKDGSDFDLKPMRELTYSEFTPDKKYKIFGFDSKVNEDLKEVAIETKELMSILKML